MNLVLKSFINAFNLMRRPSALRLVFYTLLVTAAILLVFVGGVQLAMAQLRFFEWGWLEWIVDFLIGGGAIFISWFFFPLLIPSVASLFDERIMRAAELDTGIDTPDDEPDGLLRSLAETARFVLLALSLNVLALPLYILLPGINLILYYMLNGYLLGREFFDAAGARHIGIRQAKQLRRRYRLNVWAAGALIAFMMTIPFLNLLTPFIAVAGLTYLFHGLHIRGARGHSDVVA